MKTTEIIKPIYYLGAKNSFLSEIRTIVDSIKKESGPVCDLFSGSGVVGNYLSQFYPVTTVDIQEYSKVISSALFKSNKINIEKIRKGIEDLHLNEVFHEIYECIRPLCEYERRSIDGISQGNVNAIVEIVESYPLNACLSSPDKYFIFNELQKECYFRLNEKGLDLPQLTTTLRYFGGVYFSYYQAFILDMILYLSDRSDDDCKDFIKAIALSSASSIVNTIGKQFAQPIRPRNKDGSIKKNLNSLIGRDRNLDPIKIAISWIERYKSNVISNYTSNALRMDYQEALDTYGKQFSVVYADPPYTRDHYSRFYHVLETMSLRDEPVITTSTRHGVKELSRGFYREERHQSPFCIRSLAPKAFDNLFKSTSSCNTPLVLSYSPHEEGDGTHPRVVSTKDLIKLASIYYPHVEVIPVEGITHNKFNKRDLMLEQRNIAEIFLKCTF
ncbi:DNA adenine methylase [Dickeya oryzae]|uniref:DNA adenine methylase n=1 Tax=Dickeya oryzae TaxID=1240404 RepID=UPI0003A81394|nr:DNA adenine methylase [Dickeya oryzae]